MARRFVAIGIVVLAASCNAVLGIGEAELDPELGQDAGGGTGGAVGMPIRVENAACTEEGTLVCGASADGKTAAAALYCNQGKLEKVFACPGIQSCIDGEAASFIACGTQDVNLPFAKTGAPCPADRTTTCAFDPTILLECVGGAWTESRHCAPSRCANKTSAAGARTLACENGGYAPGDRCALTAGTVVCSVDQTALLACPNGTATVHQTCTGGTQCTDVGTGFACR